MRTVVRVGVALGALTAAALALGGCSRPAYQFIGNDKHDIVLKVPSGWDKLNSDDVLKAQGVDPAQQTSWLGFYDAATRPAVEHALTAYTDQPMLLVQSASIAEDEKSSVTTDYLRDAYVPVSAEGVAGLAADGVAPEVKILRTKNLDTKTERGVHLVFSYTKNGRTEIYDKIAVSDPKVDRLHVVVVHCSKACFDTRGQEIEKVVSSLTVKP